MKGGNRLAVELDGKSLAKKMLVEIKDEVAKKGLNPGLAVVIVGDNPASRIYVDSKKKDCKKCGIRSEEFALPENTSEAELLELVSKLNSRADIHGILVQLPLPKGLNSDKVIQAIAPNKDVDGFHMYNVWRIFVNDYAFLPCTPAGIVEILAHYKIDPRGKHCVVVGRSTIVGKPMAMMLTNLNATVTVCHSVTVDLPSFTRQADILVSAIGRADFITADMVKKGAVVIDVGINRREDGSIVGDVDYEAVNKIASFITPVPGGVGPMTRALLMKNTLEAAKVSEAR